MNKAKKNKKRFILPRLMAWTFAAIAAAQAISMIGGVSSPEVVMAKEVFDAQVPIPGAVIEFDSTTRPIAMYIKAVYTYAVGAVGILAAVMLMVGGLRWILAGGNSSSISEAKDIIFSSISGLVLVMTSYLILSQINPSLVDLEKNIVKVQTVEIEKSKGDTSKGKAENLGNCKSYSLADQSSKDACKSFEGYNFPEKSSPENCVSEDKNLLCCCKSIEETEECIGGILGIGSKCLKCPENLWPHSCQKCNDCTKLEAPIIVKPGSNGMVNSSFAAKLTNALNYTKNAGTIETIDWQITEAWPPTVKHYNPCQYDGTCVDVGLTNGYNKDKVQAFVKSFKDAGLKPVFECPESGCCEKVGLTNDKNNCQEFTDRHITGSHFSIYQ